MSTFIRFKESSRRDSFVRYKVTRNEGLSSSIQYEESSKRDFVRPIRSCAKGWLVLVRLERGIKQAGLRPSVTKSCDRNACPRPAGTRNQASGTTSIQYEVVQGELLHVCPLRGIKLAVLRTSSTKSREWWACPRLSDTRIQLGGNSSVRYKVKREECLSSSV